MKNIILLVATLFSVSNVYGQLIDKKDEFKMIGYARLGLEFGKGRADLSNYSSRVGFEYNRSITEEYSLGAQFEWGVDLLNGSAVSGGNGDGSYPLTSSGDFLTNRLSNILVNTKYGVLRVGKQWSTYSEVGDWTDMFATASGESLGIYSYGSDGGYLGTGRADKALTYRTSFKSLALGLQYQALGKEQVSGVGTNNGGYGANIIYTFMKKFKLGVAYNHVDFRFTSGQKLTPKSMVMSFKYESDKTLFAIGHALMNESESSSSSLSSSTIFKKSTGTEVYFDYKFYGQTSVELGYNLFEQENVGNQFEKNFLLAGIKHRLKIGEFGVMGKLDNSKNTSGQKIDDNFVSTWVRFNF